MSRRNKERRIRNRAHKQVRIDELAVESGNVEYKEVRGYLWRRNTSPSQTWECVGLVSQLEAPVEIHLSGKEDFTFMRLGLRENQLLTGALLRDRRIARLPGNVSTDPTKPLSTPAAEWRVRGESDPFDNQYDCERAQLTLGSYTDDELANGIFMNYDRPLDIDAAMNRKPDYHSPIVWMTAGKERIRWLSLALEKALGEAVALRQTMERGALIDLRPAEQDPSVSAMQRLTEALQANRGYAWSWHCNLAMPIMDSLKCSPEYANKAGADLMQYLFKIDVRKFEEWHHDEPPALVQNVESAHLEQARATLEAMKPSKIYDERDRGYIKALSHVTDLLPSLLTPPVVNQPRIADASFAGGAAPTHYCKECNALWRRFMNDGAAFWNLRSKQCGPCCDNVLMGDQIVEMDQLPDVAVEEWEYETVERGRKSSGEIYPPDGEGWERDYSRGRPGEAWDRFDNHEETYWKRRKSKA